MLERVYDPKECREVTDKNPDYFSFDVEEWFENPTNYCLKEGDNIGLGEYKSPGVYWVHFCYNSARGREAIELTKRILKKFTEDCDVRVSVGLILKENRKSRWLVRQVGFKSAGDIDTDLGPSELFYWINRSN